MSDEIMSASRWGGLHLTPVGCSSFIWGALCKKKKKKKIIGKMQ